MELFFLRIDNSHCNGIHSTLTAVHCFNNGCVGKQPTAWKEYCAKNWLEELQKSMDRCPGRSNMTEILLKTVLNTIKSINKGGWYERYESSSFLYPCKMNDFGGVLE